MLAIPRRFGPEVIGETDPRRRSFPWAVIIGRKLPVRNASRRDRQFCNRALAFIKSRMPVVSWPSERRLNGQSCRRRLKTILADFENRYYDASQLTEFPRPWQ